MDKPLRLLSVNGPQVTLIEGYQLPGTTNGDGAIRCVYLTNGASLVGFTLTNGATRISSGNIFTEQNGGGVWCESTNAWISNCVITGNSARSGGGSSDGALYNCTISGNSADYGGGGSYNGLLHNCLIGGNSASGAGGSSGSTLVNCTLTDNSASGSAGGSAGGTLRDCVLANNTAGRDGGGAQGGTLTRCRVTSNSAARGGGAFNSTLNNCTITHNLAEWSGGGTYGGTVNDCVISQNSAGSTGGGSYVGVLYNCTLTGNAADSGGGSYSSALTNCIAYYNTAKLWDNYSGAALDHCCTTPLPNRGGGNFTNAPQLASVTHLSSGSPCVGAGSTAGASGTDIDGEPWASPPSIGCDEYWAGSITGALSITIQAAYTNVNEGFLLDCSAMIDGHATTSVWDFGDGTIVSNQPYVGHAWSSTGVYQVIATAYNETWLGGVSATATVHVAESVLHVALSSTNPIPPYTSWSTAATNIQEAVDAASIPGSLVLVSNGVYATGGRAVYGLMTNRVVVDKPLTLLSVNGPESTFIEGHQVPGTTNGDGAIRCVYLTNRASLIGFTLTNGATRTSGDWDQEQQGGGVACEYTNSWVSNCVMIGNSANYGGGSCRGSLIDCLITGNSAETGGGASSGSALSHCVLQGNSAGKWGGGAYGGTLYDCILNGNWSLELGGAAYNGTLDNCTLTNNSAIHYGGAAYACTLGGCMLNANTAVGDGGGAYGSDLFNCGLDGNMAANGGGAINSVLTDCWLTGNTASTNGGGVFDSSLTNCIVSENVATAAGGGASTSHLEKCQVLKNQAVNAGGGAVDSTLNNCAISDNSAMATGGGASGGVLNNCVLRNNTAGNSGGGVRSSTVNNSLIIGNSAYYGGGTAAAALNNCTLTGNSATSAGGGAYQGSMNNCVIFYNFSSGSGDNYVLGLLNHCCTTPLPPTGTGNISAQPLLSSGSHLSAASPCIGSGNPAYASGVDLDGDPWASPPSIGCDEYVQASLTGSLAVAFSLSHTNVAVDFETEAIASIEGSATVSIWDFGDGTVLSNHPYASHSWMAPGDYEVTLAAFNESWPGGISATSVVHVQNLAHYVSATGNNPVPPYTNWMTAATNIQDAVDAATAAGAVIIVTNGLYATGGRTVQGTLTNRVAADKPLTLKSVNGPEFTIIRGYQVPGTTNGDAAVRCAYLTNGASLIGFTLTNGGTRQLGDWRYERSGGGLLCEPKTAWASNCVLVGNSADRYGGGVNLGRLENCEVQGNSANYGGGGAASYFGGIIPHPDLLLLNNCSLTENTAPYGGGTSAGILNRCTLQNNSALGGGGVAGGMLNNCALVGNNVNQTGGGASGSILNSCVVVGNSAGLGGGGVEGSGQWTNCILYYNTAPNNPNYSIGNKSGPVVSCCTTPLPAPGRGATGNITDAPLFVNTNDWENLRLQSNSPCINAGNNAYVTSTNDLDDNPRIVGGTVDIGAYEFQSPQSVISYAYLQQFGLPTDGSADDLDSDSDSHTTWQEWKAWTDPTNALSVLRMLNPQPDTNGISVSWESVAGNSYLIERATNADAPFSLLQNNIVGQVGTTTFTDTNVTNGETFFYRIGVK